jgi:hypothetical protein
MCKKHYSNWYYYNAELAERGHSINKKEDPGYEAAHWRVRIAKGRAANHLCVDCGGPATDWSLKHDASEKRVQSSGRMEGATYSLDADDYEARCQCCHKRYDADHGNRRYKTGQYARHAGGNA